MINSKSNFVNASSSCQDTLPVSSYDLLLLLDTLNIEYKLFAHQPLRTVAESKKIQSSLLVSADGGGHIKNLFLRDHKKNNILLVVAQDTIIDLKKIRARLGVGRLSFGSEERLLDSLGVNPGAVTPFSMITGIKNGVSLFIEKSLRDCKKLYLHPMVNDRTVELSPQSLEYFFEYFTITPEWLDLNYVIGSVSGEVEKSIL